MKVFFPLIQAGSGSDVFIHNLASGLKYYDTSAQVCKISPIAGFIPSFAAKLCDTTGSDIIHANTWNGYSFKNDIPLVATEYHVAPDPLFLPYTSYAQRAFYRILFQREMKTLSLADRVTTISEYTKKRVEAIFGYSDSEMIYCGIDTTLFSPASILKESYNIDEEKTILLFVGNHLRRKGSDLLNPIMKELGDDFILFTTSGLRTSRRVNADNIRCLGKIGLQGLIQAYNLCDILLFPSRMEGFGLCVAEAMSCEKPVITTNTSSLPELVDQDKGGILCEINDIPGFVKAVRYLSEDENLRSSMGKYNRRKVLERFTIDRMASKYEQLYRRVS